MSNCRSIAANTPLPKLAALHRGEPPAYVDSAVTALTVSSVEAEGLSRLVSMFLRSPYELTAGHRPIIAPYYAK